MKPKFSCPIVFALVTVLFASVVEAGCNFSSAVGWTIVYSGTVTGYINEDGEEESSFNGCEYDRVLLVDYSKSVTCRSYGYAYAYHPDILVLRRQYKFEDGRQFNAYKACIDDDMYDVRAD